MAKLFGNTLKLGLALLVNVLIESSLAAKSPAVASQTTDSQVPVSSLKQITQYTQDMRLAQAVPASQIQPTSEGTDAMAQVNSVSQLTEGTDTMAQVNSVSQLSDVQPSDWAFQALQSLVERYGVIAGYPDSTYRGNRAMTRYEFAAGLNAALERINELITAGTANLLRKEDLTTLQRLQNEFAPELATLRGRVDALEASAAQIEANQFSTTTKLNGEVITYLQDAYGDNASRINNTNLGYRLRLDLQTSFTGRDQLRTRIQATNLRLLDTGATFGGTLGGSAVTGETRVTPSSVSQNGTFLLNQLEYRFPVGNSLNVYLEAVTIDPTYVADPISPFIDTSTGALSNFGQVNPTYFPIGNRAGVAFDYKITKLLTLDGGYFGEDFFNQEISVGGPSSPGRSSGIFNGGYSAWSQLTLSNGSAKFALFYVNSYSPENGIDTLAGSNPAKVIGAGPVVGNSYSVMANFRITSGFELGGWLGYAFARTLTVKGEGRVYNYAVTLAFPDLIKKGNLGGIVFGVQPKLYGSSNDALASAIGLPFENGRQRRSDRDTGYHIEAFYRFQLNDNISITPGFFWLTAPNHDERNPDTVVGVIRTSFLF